MPDQWLSATQAAERLGVKTETLYAYVSRGLLTSEAIGGGRRGSRYSRSEVERLAARVRRGGRAGGLEVLVDSELTLLDPDGHLYYRGWDASEAAGVASYERVAEWLWTGIDGGEPATWLANPDAVEVARECCAALPSGVALVDRMRVSCAAVATSDPFRHDRRPDAVASVGRALVASLVEVLPDVAPPRGGSAPVLTLPGKARRRESVAARLWPKLSSGRPSRPDLGVLNTALVLLADHELAASTFAARVAASTWSDPYLVVQTGLAVLGGPLHGGSSEAATGLLNQVSRGTPAVEAIGSLLRTGSAVPGLGHAVYRRSDPRAATLLEAVRGSCPAPARWKAVEEVISVASDRGLPFPNVDFAVSAMCLCLDLVPGAGEAIFAVARCAGWLAHAIEEYRHRLRFRPRAVYVGPEPAPGG